MRSWLDRAQHSRTHDPFESLIHLWVAFNAWLAETIDDPTLMEKDLALINAAASDAILLARFEDLLRNDTEFAKRAVEFQSLWPVFNVRRIDIARLDQWDGAAVTRGNYRDYCFLNGLEGFAYKPACFRDHQSNPDDTLATEPLRVPFDWPHALSAIYQVRCNLFHGGKSFRVMTDLNFADLAFDILWQSGEARFQIRGLSIEAQMIGVTAGREVRGDSRTRRWSGLR